MSFQADTPVSSLTVGELRQVIREATAPAAVRGSSGADVRMIWVQDLAGEKGVDVSTIYRQMNSFEIPKRQRDGKLKPEKGRGRTYVFSLEYEGRERLPTGSVRNSLRRAGRILRH